MLCGVRIGLDVGTVRIGVAICDPDGMLAVPLETINAGPGAVDRALQLVIEHRVIAVYIGNPVNLKGASTQSTIAATSFAQQLATQLAASGLSSEVSVRMIDERLSTVTAQRGLHQAGRSVKTSRKVIDQAAAVIILEHALESEKRQGNIVGNTVGVDDQ